MREYQFRNLKGHMENKIRRMVNKGSSPDRIRDHVLNSLVNSGSDSYTGRQLGELLEMVPGGRNRAAG